MTDQVAESGFLDDRTLANKLLKVSAQSWFWVALSGQWIFAWYIIAFYGGLTLEGGIAAFGKTFLRGGYVPGDTIGNLAVVSHIFIGVIIHGFGPLQLVPQIRVRFPVFHRWNGRIFLILAVLTCFGGLYMTWFRGDASRMDRLFEYIEVSIAGILVWVFAAMAIYKALTRDIKSHRRWALRLFMVVSAVWFSRIMFWGWVYLTGGIGVDFETFGGPAAHVTGVAQWLVPLAVLELYMRTQEKAGTRGKFLMAGGLFVVTLLMGIGIWGTTITLWLPFL